MKNIIIFSMIFLIGWNIGISIALDYYRREYAVAAPYQEYCEKFWSEKQLKEFNDWRKIYE